MQKYSSHITAIIFLILLIICGCGQPGSGGERNGRTGPADLSENLPVVKWTYPVGLKIPERMMSSGEGVLFADAEGNILSVRPEDGSISTLLQIPAPITGWAKDGDWIVTSAIDKMVRLSYTKKGEEHWAVDCETTPGEPTFAGEGVVFSEGLGPYRVRFHSLIDGKLLWQREFDAKPSGFAPFRGENTLFVILSDGTIQSLALPDGSSNWSFKVGDPIPPKPDGSWMARFSYLDDAGRERMSREPMFAGGIGRMILTKKGLAVPCEDGHLRMLDASSGELIWEIDFGERVIHCWLNPHREGIIFVETLEGQFARVQEEGKILKSRYLENPTGGIFHPGKGMLIVDSDSEWVPIIRDSTNLEKISPFPHPFNVIPIDGVVMGNIAVVRTDGGQIAGIEMPSGQDGA